jgi:hypothetical protein
MVPPYYSPPPFRRCPLMQIPTELRRAIFAESLVANYVPILPKCTDEAHYSSGMPSKWPKHNEMSNLMTLNKTIKDEIAEVVYEERTFVIHVHEGLLNGGIEFIDAGRQPLHFQDCPSDDRFWKFSNGEKAFGFRRLKKICIQIYPSAEENTRHCAINTFFTNLALVRQLDRSGEQEHRITSLTIRFMDSKRTGGEQGRAIQRAEHYWWDPEKNQPRATSIHGVPDIEIVLRPFANLTGCHSVAIELPNRVANDERIAVFLKDLEASMSSRYGLGFADDDLDRNIEAGRSAMEEYTFSLKHGVKHREVMYLTEDEAQDRLHIDDGDHDSSEPSTKRQKKSVLHKRASSFEDDRMRDEEDYALIRAMQDEEDDLARAIEESLMSSPNPTEEEDYEACQSYQEIMSLAQSDGQQAIRPENLPVTQASTSTGPRMAARTWAQVAAKPSTSNASRLLGGNVGVQQNGSSAGISGQQLGSAGPSFVTSIVGIRREQTPTLRPQGSASTQSSTRLDNPSPAHLPRDGDVADSPSHPFARPQVPSNSTNERSMVLSPPDPRLSSSVNCWIDVPSVPTQMPLFNPDHRLPYNDMNDWGEVAQTSYRPRPNTNRRRQNY